MLSGFSPVETCNQPGQGSWESSLRAKPKQSKAAVLSEESLEGVAVKVVSLYFKVQRDAGPEELKLYHFGDFETHSSPPLSKVISVTKTFISKVNFP